MGASEREVKDQPKQILDGKTRRVYGIYMTTYTDPINQPYVLCFVRGYDGRLRALAADPANPGISDEFAIFATRSEANSRIPQFQAGSDSVIFSVPARALFATKTVEVFALRPRA